LSPSSKPFPTKSIRCSPIMVSSSDCRRDIPMDRTRDI
jgi:hypothetical protein